MYKAILLSTTIACFAIGCNKRDSRQKADDAAASVSYVQQQNDQTEPERTNNSARIDSGSPFGIDNPSNNSDVVAATRSVLVNCNWNDDVHFHWCEAYKTWEELVTRLGETAEMTYINFLDEKNYKVQDLGLEALNNVGVAYKTDVYTATKIVDFLDSAARISSIALATVCVSKIDLNATRLGERVLLMLKSHKNARIRMELATEMMRHNPNYHGAYDAIVAMARSDPDSQIRQKVVDSLSKGAPDGKKTETCQLWLELTSDSDGDVAGMAASMCAAWSFEGGCVPQYDPLLSVIENKAKAGTVKSPLMAHAASYLYYGIFAGAATKPHALAVAKAIVVNQANDERARAYSLDFVGRADANSKQFASGFIKDPSVSVRRIAESITK